MTSLMKSRLRVWSSVTAHHRSHDGLLLSGELWPGGDDLLSDSLEVVHADRPSTTTEYRPDATASAITRSGRAFDFPQ